MEIELPRMKKLSTSWRLVFIIYSALRRFAPRKSLLVFLLNANWLSNRLAYDQVYFLTKNLELIRPKNHESFLLEINSNDIVCDFGAGDGALTREIAKKCRRVTYLDSDPRMLQVAKESLGNLANIDFHQSIDDVLMSKTKFNLVILSHVLEHIQPRVEFLASLQKLTNRLCIEIPDLESSALNYARISLGCPLWSDEDHVVEMDSESLENLLIKSGWQITKSRVRGGTIFVVAETRVSHG